MIKGVQIDDICGSCEHVAFDSSKDILDGKGKVMRFMKCDKTKTIGYKYIVTQESLDILRKEGCVKIDEIEKRHRDN